jgi:hypothetical protein
LSHGQALGPALPGPSVVVLFPEYRLSYHSVKKHFLAADDCILHDCISI